MLSDGTVVTGETIAPSGTLPTGQFDFANNLGAGGMEFAGPGGTVVSPNITPNGLGKYTDEQLATLITHGTRPDGSVLPPPMPTYFLANLKPDDVQALILYLRQLPPK